MYVSMRIRRPKVAGALIAAAAIIPTVIYAYWDQAVPIAGMAINFVRTLTAPTGSTDTEQAPPIDAGGAVVSLPRPAAARPSATSDEWPRYNKTLTSERYSPLNQINTTNVGRLKVLCTYDTRQYTSFEAGPIMVHNALIGTTEHDIFSIDPGTCREKWRTHEDYKPASLLAVNRGAAYMDGLLFRGTEDGRVLAYDFNTGRRVWATTIGDSSLGESTPAAPITRNGFVFIGNAGGDNKGVKGRMYALNARTGEIVWEFYLVPKSAYDQSRGPQGATLLNLATWTSYTLDPVTGELYVPGDKPGPDFAIGWREGANPYSGSVAPKDGHLYGFGLGANTLLYRVPLTWLENVDATFEIGKPSSGMATISPYHTYGAPDSSLHGAGWIYAVDADSGMWKWRLKSSYPILSGMTPTGGGLVFVGDVGGNYYALDASNGQRLWSQKIGGAVGGGVITYTTDGEQRIAVASGFTSILWPTAVVTGKIVILGL
jgi:alcohol dehydrogenase (cytochrome c)